MTSTSATSETQVTANHVEMYFNPHDKESQLDHVVCQGHAVVNSKPLAAPGKVPADSHVMRAENIDLKMRPGGRDIQTVSAHPSGTLEFLPNQPASHHRTLQGDDMLIAYGPQNHIETFHATKVTTVTDPSADELKPGPDGKPKKRPSSTTSSKELLARFDPQSSQLSHLEQTGSFSYQEGDRKAHADKATFDQKQNVMTLDGNVVGVRCHRHDDRRTRPARSEDGRLSGRGQRAIPPACRIRTRRATPACSPATRPPMRRRARWNRAIAPAAIARGTRATRGCGRAPTASAPTWSRSTAISTPSWPTATSSRKRGSSPKTTRRRRTPGPCSPRSTRRT